MSGATIMWSVLSLGEGVITVHLCWEVPLLPLTGVLLRFSASPVNLSESLESQLAVP